MSHLRTLVSMRVLQSANQHFATRNVQRCLVSASDIHSTQQSLISDRQNLIQIQRLSYCRLTQPHPPRSAVLTSSHSQTAKHSARSSTSALVTPLFPSPRTFAERLFSSTTSAHPGLPFSESRSSRLPHHGSPCPRLPHHRTFHSGSSSAEIPSSESPSGKPSIADNARVLLPSRALIAVHGPDAARFLQGLTTCNIPIALPGSPTALPGAFLNAQGRILHDFFLYTLPSKSRLVAHIPPLQNPQPDELLYLIELDLTEGRTLLDHLRKHKLRSRISIHLLEPGQLLVHSAWRDQSQAETSDSGSAGEADGPIDGNVYGAPDTRAPSLGMRILSAPTIDLSSIPHWADLPEASYDQYTIRRYLHGVAEGPRELHRAGALPQESNLDLYGAIDFRKGCYVGQELVTRTQHRGVVRKRILPATLYSATQSPPSTLTYSEGFQSVVSQQDRDLTDASIMAAKPSSTDRQSKIDQSDIARLPVRKPRSDGRWLAGIGNVGVVLGRLEPLVGVGPAGERLEGWRDDQKFVLQTAGTLDSRDTTGRLNEDERGTEERTDIGVKAFLPLWWAERQQALASR